MFDISRLLRRYLKNGSRGCGKLLLVVEYVRNQINGVLHSKSGVQDEDELEDPDAEGASDTTVTLAKNNPEQLIRRLYGSVDAWETQHENRKW